MACNFIKKSLQHSCFPVKFAKFLTTLFLQNTSIGRLWTQSFIYSNGSNLLANWEEVTDQKLKKL